MKKIITKATFLLAGFLVLVFSLSAPLACAAVSDDINSGINAAAGAADTDKTPTEKLNSTITNIVNIFSVIVGIIAVIMIIVGGFRYITSGGASDKVKGAKDTLLYAIIGLIIVALAQVIVRFVLNKSTST